MSRLYHPCDMYSGKQQYPVINKDATIPAFNYVSLPACYPQQETLYYHPEMSQPPQTDLTNAASEYRLQAGCETTYDHKNNSASSLYYYNDYKLSILSDDLATAPSSPGEHRLSHSSSSSSIASSPFSPDCCFVSSPLAYQQSALTGAYSNIGCQQTLQHPPETVSADQIMYNPPYPPPAPKSSPTTDGTSPSHHQSSQKLGQNNNSQVCDLRPYLCYICPRAFARKHDLQRHIRVHTGDKPYACVSCKKAFARTDALKRHLRMEESCRMSPEVQAMKCAGKRRYRNL